MTFLDNCMDIPNIDLIFFYILFVLIIPNILNVTKHSLIPYYLILLVSIATALTNWGEPDSFSNLYRDCTDKHNLKSAISKLAISLLSFTGIVWATYIFSNKNSKINTIMYGVSLYLVFIEMPKILPLISEKVDSYISNETNYNTNLNWHKFIIGILYILFLIGLQFLLKNLIDSVGLTNQVFNNKKIINTIKSNVSLSSVNNLDRPVYRS